jgi:hypothetical protein
VGVAVAYPAADGPPPAPYKPAPAPYKPAPYNAPPPAYKPAPSYGPPKGYKEPEYAPQPYQFEYGVSDQYTGTNFQAVENQNEKGSVIGKLFFVKNVALFGTFWPFFIFHLCVRTMPDFSNTTI